MIYEKPRAELFAQNAPESEIKPFTAWLRGLGIAFDETNGYPEMESFNGLLQALNSYIKYLEQNGFAEWSADLEYPVGAGVRVGNVWYKAKQQNTNKPPSTSQSDWSIFLNAGDLSYADPLQNIDGQIQIKDATTTQKGVTRFANSTEVANKSTTQAAITAANAATIAQSSDIGMGGQSWVNVGSSRISGATYRNDTGRTIIVWFGGGKASGSYTQFYVNGQTFAQWGGSESDEVYFSIPIPPNSTYGYLNQPNFSYTFWELR